MALGCVMLGVEGPELSVDERELLGHPLVAGVILFRRNYREPEQLQALVAAVHGLRTPRLLVAVDHEGGRVQRFRDGFTVLPAVRELGRLYERNRVRAKQLARATGWLMAAELRACGVDFSFAPVLDLDWGRSAVIGDRAFHNDPEVVADLGHAYMSGMQKAGMEAVGKHFPGHGYATADSHLELPVDRRPLAELADADMLAFERMIHYGLAAIMPAHLLYPSVDHRPAGFSPVWLRDILRGRLGFQGAIISDDLDMAGAAVAGSTLERGQAALSAGCDLLLACNDRSGAAALLQGLPMGPDPVRGLRLARLHGRGGGHPASLRATATWARVHRRVAEGEAGEPDMLEI